MVLCIGPESSGKSLLLKKLKNPQNVDETTNSVPTNGTDIIQLNIDNKLYTIREIGGGVAPIWPKYYENVGKLIFVVDTSNLCQISAAGILFYSILVNPLLKHTKFLLVLTKMDTSYRQMRNEALLMLQINKLQQEIQQNIKIVEASGISGLGREEIINWIVQ